MQKDDLVYAGHMLDTARKIREKSQGLTREAFDRDENLRLALAHLIQVLGEAARNASPAFQQAHPEIPWRQIIGMRNRVVHDYMEVNFHVVWDVATSDIPSLLPPLERLAPKDAS